MCSHHQPTTQLLSPLTLLTTTSTSTCSALHHTSLHPLYHTTLYHTSLHHNLPHFRSPHYSKLYCTTLHSAEAHCFTVYHTLPHHNVFNNVEFPHCSSVYTQYIHIMSTDCMGTVYTNWVFLTVCTLCIRFMCISSVHTLFGECIAHSIYTLGKLHTVYSMYVQCTLYASSMCSHSYCMVCSHFVNAQKCCLQKTVRGNAVLCCPGFCNSLRKTLKNSQCLLLFMVFL